LADSVWTPLPLDSKLFLNADETLLSRANAKLENFYQNDAGGFSRFPGLKPWLQLSDKGRVYLFDWQNDLIAATSNGKMFRIDKSKNAEDVTGVPVSGGKRIIFDKTESELVMAGGGQLIRFAGSRTEVLSDDAPKSTHVGTIDSFVLAPEKDTQHWQHSNAGDSRTWDPLDTFSADGKPDPVTAMLISPFREVMLCGPDSIEQWERSLSGDVPFIRRWSVGDGLKSPYALGFADNALFVVNKSSEWVRFSGQTSQPVGDDIGALLSNIDDWSEAWIGGFPDQSISWNGQKFLLLQIPNATNAYGTKGITVCFDIRPKNGKFFLLYGWDKKKAKPSRWPGWSHWPLWDQTFVGGDDGWIWTLDKATFTNGGETQRALVRTGHWDQAGECAVDDLRLRWKRGIGSNTSAPQALVRVNRDNMGFGPWVGGSLGMMGQRELFTRFGGFGMANTFQFEFQCTDDCYMEIAKAEAILSPVGH
jgi:hypothetical protein